MNILLSIIILSCLILLQKLQRRSSRSCCTTILQRMDRPEKTVLAASHSMSTPCNMGVQANCVGDKLDNGLSMMDDDGKSILKD